MTALERLRELDDWADRRLGGRLVGKQSRTSRWLTAAAYALVFAIHLIVRLIEGGSPTFGNDLIAWAAGFGAAGLLLAAAWFRRRRSAGISGRVKGSRSGR